MSVENPNLEEAFQNMFEVNTMNCIPVFIVLIVYFLCHHSTTKAAARPIMIQGAMGVETDKMIAALKNPVEKIIHGRRFVSGTYKDVPIVISVTSIGPVNVSIATISGIENFKPAAIINQGTAGAHDPSLHKYDLVIAEKSFHLDAHVTEKEYPANFSHMKLYGTYFYDSVKKIFDSTIEYPSDEKLIAAAREVLKDYKFGKVVEGKIATTQSWNRQTEMINFFREKFGSTCEEMETASVAQICKSFDVPFLGLRVIANSELNDEKFDANAPEVVELFPGEGQQKNSGITTSEICQKYALEIVVKAFQK